VEGVVLHHFRYKNTKDKIFCLKVEEKVISIFFLSGELVLYGGGKFLFFQNAPPRVSKDKSF
jgi:hypothetical protein